MRCDEAREAMSARLDGEPIDEHTLDLHLEDCSRCAGWLSAAHAVTRRARLLPVPEVPDLTEQIVAAVEADRLQPRRSGTTFTQFALLSVAGLQLALALGILLSGHDHEAPVHVAHEMGSFNVALALAYLITALQPFRAGGLLPFAGVAAGLLAVTAATDLAGNQTSPSKELPHLLAVIGFFLLWRLLDQSHPSSPTGLRRQVRPTAGKVLRRVGMAFTGRTRRMLAVVIGVAVAIPLLAGPADAHAVLESSEPGSGAVLGKSGDTVTLRFDEPITLLPSGIRVLDGSGKRVDRGDAAHAGNSENVAVRLRPNLPQGSYLVDWRVVSADSHPIGGAFTFSVGAPGQVASAPSGATGNSTVGLLLGLSRLLTFIALALLVGAAAFVVTCWPAGRNRRGMRRLLIGACATVAGTAVTGLLLQAPYAAGLPVANAFDPQLLRSVLGSPYGHATVARLVLSALAGGWLVLFFRSAARQLIGLAGAVLGLGLLFTLSAGGHANAGSSRLLALAADTGHLAAMSTWLGGLAVLAVLLLRAHRAADRAELVKIVTRFSRIAFGAVLVLVGTGIFASVQQVGSVVALLSTDYGRLLLLKIALVVVVVGIAALSRSWVRRHDPARALAGGYDEPRGADERELVLAGGNSSSSTDAVPRPRPAEAGGSGGAGSSSHGPGGVPGPAEVGKLRRSVLAEVVIALVILTITSILVVTQPAKNAYGPVNPSDASTTDNPTARLVAGPITVLLSSSPISSRELALRVDTYDANGALKSVPEMTGELRLPSQGLGPLPVSFTPSGPGHFVANTVDVPIAGEWQLALQVRVDDFNEYTVQAPLSVK
jgi:copper transport protein